MQKNKNIPCYCLRCIVHAKIQKSDVKNEKNGDKLPKVPFFDHIWQLIATFL